MMIIIPIYTKGYGIDLTANKIGLPHRKKSRRKNRSIYARINPNIYEFKIPVHPYSLILEEGADQ